jgi:hypothetical protein
MSRLRWRAGLALSMAGAVAAGLVLAVPGGASTGTAEISPEQAGYAATGAQFRSIGARVFLRQPAQYAGEVGRYSHSVQLWSSGYVVVAGVSASTSGSAYTPYAEVFDRSGHQLLATDPGAEWCDDHTFGCITTLGAFAAGETVDLYVYYDVTRGFVHFGADDAAAPDEGYMMASYQVGTASRLAGPGWARSSAARRGTGRTRTPRLRSTPRLASSATRR